jgi:hypothetical protein
MDYIHFDVRKSNGCARPSRESKPPRITANGILAIGLLQSKETAFSFGLTKAAKDQLDSLNFIPLKVNKDGQASLDIPSLQTQSRMAQPIRAALPKPSENQQRFTRAMDVCSDTVASKHGVRPGKWITTSRGNHIKTYSDYPGVEVHCG